MPVEMLHQGKYGTVCGGLVAHCVYVVGRERQDAVQCRIAACEKRGSGSNAPLLTVEVQDHRLQQAAATERKTHSPYACGAYGCHRVQHVAGVQTLATGSRSR